MELIDAKVEIQEEKFVVFVLNNEQYAVNILQVREIIRPLPVTRVPKAPDFIEGIINLRGTIIPIIDLKKCLGMELREPTKQNRILILEIEDNLLGFIIDKVNEVISISRENIHEPPDSILMIDSSFIEGIAQLGERLIVIIDFRKVLEKERFQALEEFDFTTQK